MKEALLLAVLVGATTGLNAQSRIDPQAIDELIQAIDEIAKEGDPVGAELLVIERDQIRHHRTWGWRDKESEKPVEKGTICRIRSMTKPIVATAVWYLIEEGKVKLEDPVSKFLPAFANPKSRDIRVDHLLKHIAGFDHPGYPAPLTEYRNLASVADAIGRAGPAVKIGSRYRYSDADSATLAALVAKVSGMSAEEFIQKRVLDPLGMKDTFCHFYRSDKRSEKVSSTYLRREEGLVRYWSPDREQQLPFFRGSGGIYSTPKDYARFLKFWMKGGVVGGKRLLSEESIRLGLSSTEMSRRPKSGRHYGRHWELYGASATSDSMRENGLPVFGHTGSDGTIAIAFPQQETIVLYFTQSRGSRQLVPILRRVALLRNRVISHSD